MQSFKWIEYDGKQTKAEINFQIISQYPFKVYIESVIDMENNYLNTTMQEDEKIIKILEDEFDRSRK